MLKVYRRTSIERWIDTGGWSRKTSLRRWSNMFARLLCTSDNICESSRPSGQTSVVRTRNIYHRSLSAPRDPHTSLLSRTSQARLSSVQHQTLLLTCRVLAQRMPRPSVRHRRCTDLRVFRLSMPPSPPTCHLMGRQVCRRLYEVLFLHSPPARDLLRLQSLLRPPLHHLSLRMARRLVVDW